MSSIPTRRDAIGTLAAAAFGALAPGRAFGRAWEPRPSGDLPYGAAVRWSALDHDDAYRAALLERCRIIVPEGEMKWADLRPARDVFQFENADHIADFARRNGLALRGHTLAWYGAMPEWTNAIATAREAERELVAHIETVVSRYRDVVSSWDVVNEPVPERPASIGDLRPSVWTRCLGDSYIATAFRAAAAVDPTATLVLNEYDVEFVGGRFTSRRDSLRHILRKLLDQGVPVHAVGLQGHLFAERAIDRDGLQAFLSEVKSWGLKVLITELDVVDKTLPTMEAERDRLAALKVDDFLDAVFSAIRPEAVITWGVSDRYTWVPIYFTRNDGRPNRPLPFDADMKPKPMMAVIDRYLRRDV